MKEAILLIVVVVLALAAGFVAGHANGTEAMQRQACKQGLADYDADEKGDSQFIWAVPFGEMK